VDLKNVQFSIKTPIENKASRDLFIENAKRFGANEHNIKWYIEQ